MRLTGLVAASRRFSASLSDRSRVRTVGIVAATNLMSSHQPHLSLLYGTARRGPTSRSGLGVLDQDANQGPSWPLGQLVEINPTIPSRMSSLVQLESLDLSRNYLSGEIPSGLASLTFLAVLDLSYNYLSGPVPQSGQFLTFPNTSYEWNNGLCGSPLSRQCHRPESRIRDDDDNDSANWNVLSVELGVACGLAAVTGYLLLSSRGRQWFTTHIDSLLLHVHHFYHHF